MNRTVWLLELVGAQRPASSSFSNSSRLTFSPVNRRTLRRKRMVLSRFSGEISKRALSYSTGGGRSGSLTAPAGQMATHWAQWKHRLPRHV